MVTARWRPQRLQDTPVSITAFTADDLKSRNLTNLSQIAAFTPNLVFDPGVGDTGGSTNAQVYIRGIGQGDFLFTTEPGVGIYLDGVYMARSIGSMMNLVDVEQIEVLKGPQGTVFGKNTTGGAISLTTRRPAADPGARGAVTIGDYARFDTFAAADMPIVEGKLLSKIAISSEHRDGYETRVGDGATLGGANAIGGAAQLLWLHDPDFEVLLSADYTRRRESPAANGLVEVNPAAPLLALWNGLVAGPAGHPFDARYVPADPAITYGTGPNRSNLDQGGISARAEWRSGAGVLRSITAYRAQNADFASDPDNSPADYVEQEVQDRTRQFSQEVQWLGSAAGGRLRYTLGGLYFDERGHDTYRIRIAPGLYQALEALPPGIIPGLGGPGNPVNASLDYDGALTSSIVSRSYALFAHADYQVTGAFDVWAGLRETLDHKDYHASFDRFASGITAYDVTPSHSWSALTPTAGVEYRWTPALMTYVSASRGYKAGGFNGRSETAFVAQTPFDPEYVWTYEAGLKGSWFDRRLTLDLAAFHSNYTDLQLLSLSSDGAAPVVIVQNAGAARIDGFEVELTAAPVAGMRLSSGVGHLDARYTRLDPSVTAATLADQLPKTPAWTFNAGIEQAFATPIGRLTARGDYAWRSMVQNAVDNAPILAQKAFGLLDAQLALQPKGARWSIAAFGTNLANTRYITNGLSTLDSIGTANVTHGRPREWGLRLDWRL